MKKDSNDKDTVQPATQFSFMQAFRESQTAEAESLLKKKINYEESPKRGAVGTMVTKDWYVRQIEMMIQFIAKVVFKRDTMEYSITDLLNKTFYDLLHEELLTMISAGHIDDAENLLFDRLEEGNLSCFHVAVDFYLRLNKLSDDELDSLGFSREEIDAGLKDAAKAYGAELF